MSTSEKFVSIKELWVEPIIAKISPTENEFRLIIIDHIIATQMPYPISPSQQTLAKHLQERNILSINESQQIDAVYPISAKPTSKKVFLANGQWAYALCAVDAIGFHYTFRQPVRVESQCEYSHQSIILNVNHGKIDVLAGGNQIHILHADLQHCDNWSVQCCQIMHFFSTSENLFAWQNKKVLSCHKTFCIDLELANKMAWLLFSL